MILPYRLVAGVVLGFLAPLSSQAARWVKVEYPGVRVFSDSDPAIADRFAKRLAIFHAAFDTLITPEGQTAPRCDILLFDRSSELDRYANGNEDYREFTVLAAPVEGRQITALAVTRGQDWAARVAITHETRHLLIGVGYVLPWWMAYGAGEVFASVEEAGGGVRLGRPEQRFTDAMDESRMMDWTDLMQHPPPPDSDSGKEVTAPYQVEMWLLMRGVLVGPSVPEVRRRFAILANKLNGTSRMGLPTDQAAVGEALGINARDVDQQVRIVDMSITLNLPIDVARIQAAQKMSEVSPAELDVQLYDLLAPRDAAKADERLAEAQREDPNAAVVKEALARQASRQKDAMKAVALYREAIAAGSTDGTAYTVSAQAWLPEAIDKAKSPQQRAAAAASALKEARRALELSPGNPLPYLVVGRALVLSPHVTEEEIATLKPAISDPKVGPAVEYYMGLLHRRIGNTDEAREDFQRLLGDPHAGPREKAVAQSQLAALSAPAK